jgi:hypothetical protein
MPMVDKKRRPRGTSAYGVFDESKRRAQAIIDEQLIMLRAKTEALRAMRLANSPPFSGRSAGRGEGLHRQFAVQGPTRAS